MLLIEVFKLVCIDIIGKATYYVLVLSVSLLHEFVDF